MTTQDAHIKPHGMSGPVALAIAIVSSFILSLFLKSGTVYGAFITLTIAVYLSGIFILLRDRLAYSSIYLFLYLFIIYIIFNPFWSIHLYRSIFQILVLCQIPLFFFLLSTERIQKSWDIYLLLMPIPALISSAWGIIEFIQIDQSIYTLRHHRIDGFLYDPNSYAAIQYIFSILLFSLSYIHTPRSPLIRWSIWFIQILVITALLLSLSRAGIAIWLLFILAIYLYSLINKVKKLKKHVYIHLLIALLSYGFLQILVAQVDQPLERDDLPSGFVSSSLSGRPVLWEPTYSLIAERPLLGWGLNTYVSLYPSVRTEHTSGGITAHNDYIQFALEGGILLLLFLLLYLGIHLYLFFRVFTNNIEDGVGNKSVELVLMLLANLALLFHSTINFSFYIIQLCILSGIIFSRVYYLSVSIGLLKQPAYFSLTKKSKGLLVALLSIVMLSILYRGISGFLFINSERYEITKVLSANDTLLNIFTSITPLDHASVNKLIANAFLKLNTTQDASEKKKIIDYAISILQPLLKQYPYDPINYYNLGNLYQYAYLQLPSHSQIYKDYAGFWARSIQVDPGYIPSYLKLCSDLYSKARYQEALTILNQTLPWIMGFKVSRNNVLLIHEMLEKLVEKTGDELQPLYTKALMLLKRGDHEAYLDTLRELIQTQKSRKAPVASLYDAPSLHEEVTQ